MTTSWLARFQFGPVPKKLGSGLGFAYFLGHEDAGALARLIELHALDWQLESLRKNNREMVYFTGRKGPVWILKPKDASSAAPAGHWGLLAESAGTWTRDMAGSLLSYFRAHQLQTVVLEFIGTDEAQEMAAFVGFDLAAYNFRETYEGKESALPKVHVSKVGPKINPALVKEARARAAAVNFTRHLVNLPQ